MDKLIYLAIQDIVFQVHSYLSCPVSSYTFTISSLNEHFATAIYLLPSTLTSTQLTINHPSFLTLNLDEHLLKQILRSLLGLCAFLMECVPLSLDE
jgi:hypothetical protein